MSLNDRLNQAYRDETPGQITDPKPWFSSGGYKFIYGFMFAAIVACIGWMINGFFRDDDWTGGGAFWFLLIAVFIVILVRSDQRTNWLSNRMDGTGQDDNGGNIEY